MPPTALTSPDPLSPAQEAQIERDLKLLLPNGPLTGKLLLPEAHPHPKVGPELVLPSDLLTVHQPKSVLHWRRFPMGGLVYWQVPARMQREDQGQDFEIPLGHHIIAPAWGKCIHHLSDQPFPNGFGSPYAVVYIGAGRFGGRLWYIGHDNGSPIIPEGWTFHQGRILATPNHFLNAGWGWTEFGHAPNGHPGPFGEGARYHSLFAPLWRWSTT